MRIDVVDPAHASVEAARLVLDEVRTNPATVLGLATGASPLRLYEALIPARPELYGLTGVALDEYIGLPAGHPQSYRATLERCFAVPLGLPMDRIHVPTKEAGDPDGTAGAFERLLRDLGGVDLQILGIGSNGHIGFNEPGSAHDSRTRVVRLADRTRRDNARYFSQPEQVPASAVTQGVGTILGAQKLLLLAFGGGKAKALKAALEGPVDIAVPASALQLHNHVTVLADPAAASLLTAIRGAGGGSRRLDPVKHREARGTGMTV